MAEILLNITWMRKWIALAAVLLLALVLFWWPRRPEVLHLGPRPGPIVFLGDSLTFGTGSESGKGWIGLLAGRYPGRELINKGVPGDTTARALQRLERDVLAFKPALVVVELGGNDFLQKVDNAETFANLDKIITQIQSQGTPVLLLGVRSGVFANKGSQRYRELARQRKTALVEDIMAGIWKDPRLKADPLHPNDAGYALVAQKVGRELDWLVKEL